ncbi:MAG: OstA-like protein [Capnocytophaga sp.]|nr:OstA-like protein [Capnocytophaga sp.]
MFCILCCASVVTFAQQPPHSRLIHLVNGRDFIIDNEKYPGAKIFMITDGEQVQFNHQGMDLWCDLAVYFEDKNELTAMGNVFVQQGDSLKMNSQYVAYDGNKRTAVARENVSLTNEAMTLDTQELFLDRNTQQAYYTNYGRITDKDNVLTSKEGTYYIGPKKNHFTTQVKIVNPEFEVDSEMLDYYHPTGNAYLFGATTITGKDYKTYSERGFYDTRNEQGYFMQNAKIEYDLKTLVGDSLYFDKRTEFSSATNNIVVTDTVNNTVVKGHYAELYKAKDSMFITNRAVVISLIEKDSIYMHGKKIMVTGKEKERIIRAYPDARIFKSDMQAKCDSIHSSEHNGLTQLIGRPVMWSGESQMTGDNIHLIANTLTEQLDSLKVFNNAFVVEKDTLGTGYNQVKGRSLYGTFADNKLRRIDFVQNTESIQYVYNEGKTPELVGISKLACSHIRMYFDAEQQVESIVVIKDPSGALYPEDKLHPNDRKFRDFVWRGGERIYHKDEIFSESEKNIPLKVIKGLQTPEEIDVIEIQKATEIPIQEEVPE